MSDTETTEVQEPTQMELNLNQFVDAIQASNFNNAGDLFNDMLGSKMQDAMDAEKVAVADTIFNDAPEEEEIEELELDLEDEDESEEDEVEEEEEDELS
jgi:hypothetical protein